MRTVALLFAAMASTLVSADCLAAAPRGTVMELHSCELYAGGCTVSSESTTGGRYMVRAWNFTGGSYAGVDLAGLRLALLQSSSENLAASKADPGQSVVYLPRTCTQAQREALLSWLHAEQPGLDTKSIRTRNVTLAFMNEKDGCRFSAGDFVSVRTASLESCDTGACGESLWYTPQSPTALFTVAVDQASRVEEPLLGIKWVDSGKRSVFLGRFDGDAPAREAYVTAADLCGPTGVLF
jgi:hypothetical protein